jgi:hypothetical protein
MAAAEEDMAEVVAATEAEATGAADSMEAAEVITVVASAAVDIVAAVWEA